MNCCLAAPSVEILTCFLLVYFLTFWDVIIIILSSCLGPRNILRFGSTHSIRATPLLLFPCSHSCSRAETSSTYASKVPACPWIAYGLRRRCYSICGSYNSTRTPSYAGAVCCGYRRPVCYVCRGATAVAVAFGGGGNVGHRVSIRREAKNSSHICVNIQSSSTSLTENLSERSPSKSTGAMMKTFTQALATTGCSDVWQAASGCYVSIYAGKHPFFFYVGATFHASCHRLRVRVVIFPLCTEPLTTKSHLY